MSQQLATRRTAHTGISEAAVIPSWLALWLCDLHACPRSAGTGCGYRSFQFVVLGARSEGSALLLVVVFTRKKYGLFNASPFGILRLSGRGESFGSESRDGVETFQQHNVVA